MILKKQLLNADNLNAAFISKQDTASQSIKSPAFTIGGRLNVKSGGSFISDNESSSYLRIDPQGNELVIYDGVNNQIFSVYSSSGSEKLYLTTINGTPSKGIIDISSAVDHLEINTNSGKYVAFGGNVGIGTGATAPIEKLHIRHAFMDYLFGSDHLTLQSRTTMPETYPYLEFKDSIGARGAYFGWGAAKSIFEIKLESGTNLQIDGGNVSIGVGSVQKKMEVFGDFRVARNNPAINSSAYGTGHIEMMTYDGSAPRIGFHRSGFTAVALYHDGDSSNPLKMMTSGGVNVSVGLSGRKTAAQLNDTTLLGAGTYTNIGDGILNNDGTVFKAGWYHIFHSKHYDNNGYAGQIAIPFSSNPDYDMYFRFATGGTWNPWRKILTQDGQVDVRNGTFVLPVGANRWAT